jgi:TfoX/Sxy family transcriptional regulator of competence genes
MATRQRTIDFLLEQTASAGAMAARKMFGEYGLYCDGVFIGVVCDDNLFLKPTKAGAVFEAECTPAPPYPGAKPSWLVSEALIDDPERLGAFIKLTRGELAKPKTTAKKVKSARTSRKRNG